MGYARAIPQVLNICDAGLFYNLLMSIENLLTCGSAGACCMCTCIVSLAAQIRLICSWCMKICLRRAAHIRAAHISANGYANGCRYGYEYGCGYRSKSVYIRAFWPREIS